MRTDLANQFAHLYRPALAVLLLGMLDQARAATIFAADFNSGNGGFTVNTPIAYDGPWAYSAGTGSWQEFGQAVENSRPNTSMLNSPNVIVPASGAVSLSFAHRYSFEPGRWDGGQVRLSVNNGAYTTVPNPFTANGYNGTMLPNTSSVLAGQSAFVDGSPGFGAGAFLLSSVGLGTFTAGDTLSVQFIAGSDTNTVGGQRPNWEITSFELTGVDDPGGTPVPEPGGTLALLALGLSGLSVARRYFQTLAGTARV
jgi:hypothetical protein